MNDISATVRTLKTAQADIWEISSRYVEFHIFIWETSG